MLEAFAASAAWRAVRGLVSRVTGWGGAVTTGNTGAALGAALVAVLAAMGVGLLLWSAWPRTDPTAAAELARGIEAERAATLTRALAERDEAEQRAAKARDEAETYRQSAWTYARETEEAFARQPSAAEVQAIPEDIVARIAARQRAANARIAK